MEIRSVLYYIINILLSKDGGPACTNNALRMIRSQTGTPFNNRGRIEICSGGQWGTICDDGWGTNDAKVACAQLGFSKNSTKTLQLLLLLFLLIDVGAYYNSVFGRGYGPIVMHHLTCSSTESTIAQCGKTLGSSGCSHSEDAGARCAGTHACMHAC